MRGWFDLPQKLAEQGQVGECVLNENVKMKVQGDCLEEVCVVLLRGGICWECNDDVL